MKRKRSKTTKTPEPDPVPCWIPRKSIGESKTGRDGKTTCIVTVELVHGFAREGKIIGDSFHELTGPTAEKSIQEFANRLNAEDYPPKKIPRRIFGGKPIKNDPNQLTFQPA